MNVYCNNCGSKHEPDHKFCGNCGQLFINNEIELPALNSKYPSQIRPIEIKTKPKFNFSKQVWIPLIIIMIIGITAVMLFTKSNKGGILTDEGYKGTRTIMIYMVGSDLESINRFATNDINEMINANPNLKDNKIILYVGGARKWFNGFSNNAIYEMHDNEFRLVKQDDANSMGNAKTLTNFMNYAYEHYKSELYDLFFWDHGAGPILGFGVDELHNKSSLKLTQIEEAIKNSNIIKNHKLEIVGFDACLMASIELADLLSPYANYLVSSQDTEPGYGWDYAFLSNLNRNTNSISLGKSIIDNFNLFYEILGLNKSVALTLSLIDLSKIQNVEDKIDLLFKDVDVELSNGGYSKIVNQLTKSKCFQCNDYDNSYDLIDLYGAVTELKTSYEEKATNLLKSLDDAIIYQRGNVTGAYGLSIYYPYYTKVTLSQWLPIYNSLNFADGYKDFITNYTKTLLGEKIANIDLKSSFPELSKDENTISIKLDKKVQENYNKSKYIIFKDMKDGYYTPVFSSTDTTLSNDGTLTANFKKQELNIVDGNGEKFWIIGNEHERTKDYVIYSLTTTLHNWDADIDMSEWKMVTASILLKVDNKNPKGEIIGIIPVSDINDPASLKKNIDLKDFKVMEFWNHRYKIFDSKGKFTWNWIGAGESGDSVYGVEVFTNEKYSIEFNDLEAGYDYICIFVVNDTQGNQYLTNPVKVNK